MELFLHDNWQFSYKNNWYPAKVPGTVHTDLWDNDIIGDPFYADNEKKYQWIDKESWCYKSSFDIPKEMLLAPEVYLHFNGVDTYAKILLNGNEILKTKNMFLEYELEIKQFLKESGNSLEVQFESPIKYDKTKIDALGFNLPASNDTSEVGEVGEDKFSVHARKAPYHYGWDWGPRFVTCGLFKEIFLKTENEVRVTDVYYHQKNISSELAEIAVHLELSSLVDCNDTVILKINDKVEFNENISLKKGTNKYTFFVKIPHPKLWWPNRLGEQYRYDFELSLGSGDSDSKKIGLRKIELVREKDNQGESFMFRVNDIEVFMKGANHIPNDNFIPRITRKDYEREIVSAKKANLNMIRVWGGGYYEHEDFYDLCDEHGILLWQDFMFACSMYPWDKDFFDNVEEESSFVIRRLRSRTCLALWCGNNENDLAWVANYGKGWNWKDSYSEEQREQITRGYNQLFYDLLDKNVALYDYNTAYWPSSPWTGDKDIHAKNLQKYGDTHFWGVWHSGMPFSAYGDYVSRFISEYGVQSFPSVKTLEKVTPKGEMSLDSTTMLSHQKSGIGNDKIKHYISEYFEDTDDFEQIVHLSQLSQGEAMRYAIEVHRANKPYCMGSLYWQINDIWPGPSWSSIDYYGNWKASHHMIKEAARDIILFVKEDESELLQLFAVSDILEDKNAVFKVEVKSLSGEVLQEYAQDYIVKGNASQFVKTFSRTKLLSGKKPSEVYAVFSLIGDDIEYQRTYFFDKIHNLQLKKPKIDISVGRTSDNIYEIKVVSDVLTRYFGLETDTGGYFSRNYFDLEAKGEYKIYFETKNKKELTVNDFTVSVYN